MALQMTRQQYEETYGGQPTQRPSSELDTTPSPIQMTRDEYNAKYRPELLKKNLGFFGATAAAFKDIPQDIQQIRTEASTARAEAEETAGDITEQVVEGEVSPEAGTIGITGAGAQGGARGIGSLALGLLRLPFSPEAEEKIGSKVSEIFSGLSGEIQEEWQRDLAELKASSDPRDRQVAQDIELMKEAYKTDPDVKTTVDGVGGFAEAALELFGLGKAKQAGTATFKYADELASQVEPKLAKTGNLLPEKLFGDPVKKAESDLFDIENSYSQTRKVIDASKDSGVSSRVRIANSGVLSNAVDENGVIRTTMSDGPVAQYKAMTVDGVEDVVRRILVAENQKINVNEVGRIIKQEVSKSSLEGSDLVSALNGIQGELEGLSLRADDFGNIPLSKIHDAKISTTGNINYLADAKPTITFRKAKAAAYKAIVEKNSKAKIKDINAELAKYYEDIDRLKKFDGKRVKGGRLGKHFASLGGQIVGGAGGAVAGPLGSGAGAFLGGEIAQQLHRRAMQRALRTKGETPTKNPILERAKKEADGGEINLKKNDPVVGVPEGAVQNAETRLLERKISDNVKAQKKAIKAGDYGLVAALKEAYQSLVERLKEVIEEINENTQIGLSIKATVTPLSVAKKMDIDDVELVRLYLDDPTSIETALDDNIQRLFDEVGISNATDDIKKKFLEDSLVEVDQLVDSGKHKLIPKGTQRLYHQDKNITNNTTPTDSINSNVDDVVEDVKTTDGDSPATTKTTDLLEEAKKYDSAEEFVESRTNYYHGSPKEISGDVIPSESGILGRGFYLTQDEAVAKNFAQMRNLPVEEQIEGLQKVVDRSIEPIIHHVDTTKMKLKELGDGDRLLQELNGRKIEELHNELINQGYDGISLTKRGETVVFPSSLDKLEVKTRSQLEDIWKQAND